MIMITVNMVHVVYKHNINAEETVIPVITSIADFIGTVFLIFMFKYLEIIKDPNYVYQLIQQNITLSQQAEARESI